MSRRFTMEVTCDECGYSGPIATVERHSCEHERNVSEFGGRCEDYPACGHTDGDGCSLRPEHTKEYWGSLYDDLAAKGYAPDEIDDIMCRDDY